MLVKGDMRRQTACRRYAMLVVLYFVPNGTMGGGSSIFFLINKNIFLQNKNNWFHEKTKTY
jgi:hypothetical protein